MIVRLEKWIMYFNLSRYWTLSATYHKNIILFYSEMYCRYFTWLLKEKYFNLIQKISRNNLFKFSSVGVAVRCSVMSIVECPRFFGVKYYPHTNIKLLLEEYVFSVMWFFFNNNTLFLKFPLYTQISHRSSIENLFFEQQNVT